MSESDLRISEKYWSSSLSIETVDWPDASRIIINLIDTLTLKLDCNEQLPATILPS